MLYIIEFTQKALEPNGYACNEHHACVDYTDVIPLAMALNQAKTPFQVSFRDEYIGPEHFNHSIMDYWCKTQGHKENIYQMWHRLYNKDAYNTL